MLPIGIALCIAALFLLWFSPERSNPRLALRYGLLAVVLTSAGILLMAYSTMTPTSQAYGDAEQSFDYDYARNNIPDKTNWGCFDIYPEAESER